jgi:hypothetical protein
VSGLHPARMTPRDEAAHPVIKDAIAKGHVVSGEPYPIDGFEGHEAANRGRMSVRRGCQHLGVSCACWVVDADGERCYKDCKDGNAPHGLRIRLFPKDSGRKYVAEQTGGDPSKLKYNPFKRAESRILDDSGRHLT